jgi:uncharacterized repeat protein (TIGR03803 family)
MKFKSIVVALSVLGTLTLICSAQAKVKVLHSFGSTGDGSIPYGPPLLDLKGNLYGVTTNGGTGVCSDYGCGTTYDLIPKTGGTWSEKILHSFTAGSDGGAPWGGLLLDSAGNLYGTVKGDFTLSAGIFELSPGSSGWTNTILYNVYSGPGLVFDKTGNLYGSMGGGTASVGAVGELSPGSGGWSYSELYSFCPQYGCPDGWSEPAPPIFDHQGNLWGVATYGGISLPPCANNGGCGVVFEMTPNGDGTWTYNVIHFFASSSTDGQFPQGGLAMDAAGNFYGTTEDGGAYNHGTIFKLAFDSALSQWVETVLFDFPNCAQACFPVGTLAIDKVGTLYGTTLGGVFNQTCGGFTCGEVFEMARQGSGRWKFAVLHKFVGTDGNRPLGVIHDGKGNLFGTTMSGGTYGAGTAFEITP